MCLEIKTHRGVELDILQIARWFAMGEAILRSTIGKKSDPYVGHLIEPTGPKAHEKFSPESKGVILRREMYRNPEDDQYHIMLDTGEIWGFSEKNFNLLPKAQQKFPDVE